MNRPQLSVGNLCRAQGCCFDCFSTDERINCDGEPWRTPNTDASRAAAVGEKPTAPMWHRPYIPTVRADHDGAGAPTRPRWCRRGAGENPAPLIWRRPPYILWCAPTGVMPPGSREELGATPHGWFTLASGRPVSGPIRARTGPEGSFPLAARTWNWWTGPDLVWMLAGRLRVPDPRLTPAVHSSRPGRGTSTEAHTKGHTNGWTPASHLRRSASVWMMEGNTSLSF